MSHWTKPVGRWRWVVPEGYLPEESRGPQPEMASHGTICVLKASAQPAQIHITLFFSDQDPVGPYHVVVPARRTRHIRFNELEKPRPVPKATDFSTLIESDVPVVVQHTRLDSRQAENALMTTIAFPEETP